MSNLQVLARRCPVMGKAMAVQSSRSAMAGGVAVAMRAYHSKANLHTTASQQARPTEYTHVKEDGKSAGDISVANVNFNSATSPCGDFSIVQTSRHHGRSKASCT